MNLFRPLVCTQGENDYYCFIIGEAKNGFQAISQDVLDVGPAQSQDAELGVLSIREGWLKIIGCGDHDVALLRRGLSRKFAFWSMHDQRCASANHRPVLGAGKAWCRNLYGRVESGGRWRVLNVNDSGRRLTVTKASSAGAPRYGGTAQAPSGLVAARMKSIYDGHSSKGLDVNEATAAMIKEGRKAYRDYHLDRHRFLQYGQDVIVFPWSGARLAQTMVLALRREGAKASIENFAVFVEKTSAADLKDLLVAIKEQGLPETDELAREARQLQSDRFDRYLIPYHQRLAFSRRFLVREGFAELIDDLLAADAVTVG